HPTIGFSDEQRNRVGPAAAQIFRDALELGGSISAEHGLGALKRDYAELEHGAGALDVMRGLKKMLDPRGLLNPHKVFPESPADDGFLERQPGWGAKLASGRDRSELGAYVVGAGRASPFVGAVPARPGRAGARPYDGDASHPDAGRSRRPSPAM